MNIPVSPTELEPVPFRNRQNRRRERPGSRTRRTLLRRESNMSTYTEGLYLARSNTPLPSDPNGMSALMRHNYDQQWLNWKAREAAQMAALRVKIEQQEQQRRVFGGDVDDDVSLCPAMLDVVRFLWGDIDYTDP